MKLTLSVDGQKRANVRITLRFSEEEIKDIKSIAEKYNTTWRKWLSSHAALGIEEGLMNQDYGEVLQ